MQHMQGKANSLLLPKHSAANGDLEPNFHKAQTFPAPSSAVASTTKNGFDSYVVIFFLWLSVVSYPNSWLSWQTQIKMFGGGGRDDGKKSVADRAKQAREERAAQRKAKEKSAITGEKLELVKRVLRRKVAQLKVALSLRSKFDNAMSVPTTTGTVSENTSSNTERGLSSELNGMTMHCTGSPTVADKKILLTGGDDLNSSTSTDSAGKEFLSLSTTPENRGFPQLSGEQIFKCASWLLFAMRTVPESSDFPANKKDHTRTIRLARIILKSLDAPRSGGDHSTTVTRSYASQALVPKRMAAWMAQVASIHIHVVSNCIQWVADYCFASSACAVNVLEVGLLWPVLVHPMRCIPCTMTATTAVVNDILGTG